MLYSPIGTHNVITAVVIYVCHILLHRFHIYVFVATGPGRSREVAKGSFQLYIGSIPVLFNFQYSVIYDFEHSQFQPAGADSDKYQTVACTKTLPSLGLGDTRSVSCSHENYLMPEMLFSCVLSTEFVNLICPHCTNFSSKSKKDLKK
jgi:hypothetical protein